MCKFSSQLSAVHIGVFAIGSMYLQLLIRTQQHIFIKCCDHATLQCNCLFGTSYWYIVAFAMT